MPLTYERLDRLLRYDMATGLFYWKERRGKMNQSVDCRNTSGRKGVSWNRNKQKWETRIRAKNRQYFLGYFIDITRLHGEFARVI